MGVVQKVAYPDSGPVMLLSEASIKDLSGKLNKDLTAERFRPNIVIGDCEAFAEVRRVSRLSQDRKKSSCVMEAED